MAGGLFPGIRFAMLYCQHLYSFGKIPVCAVPQLDAVLKDDYLLIKHGDRLPVAARAAYLRPRTALHGAILEEASAGIERWIKHTLHSAKLWNVGFHQCLFTFQHIRPARKLRRDYVRIGGKS